MSTIKQVIVMRKDLKMQRGKENAQSGHAVMSFIAEGLTPTGRVTKEGRVFEIVLKPDAEEWLYNGKFTKICLQVNSEAELGEIYGKAKAAGLEVHLITDSGATVFHGVPTKTCLAIGPNRAEDIDKVTGHLALY